MSGCQPDSASGLPARPVLIRQARQPGGRVSQAGRHPIAPLGDKLAISEHYPNGALHRLFNRAAIDRRAAPSRDEFPKLSISLV